MSYTHIESVATSLARYMPNCLGLLQLFVPPLALVLFDTGNENTPETKVRVVVLTIIIHYIRKYYTIYDDLQANGLWALPEVVSLIYNFVSTG